MTILQEERKVGKSWRNAPSSRQIAAYVTYSDKYEKVRLLHQKANEWRLKE
jgi:hypothetical protein